MTERNDSNTIQDLIARASTGDRVAQQALLQTYWPLIHKAVRARKARTGRLLERREETADIEQAAALKILTDLRQHRWQGRSAFAAWIGKLAALEVVDRYRHHRAGKRDAGADTSEGKLDQRARSAASPESKIDDQRRMQALLARVATLKDDYGTALLMHHMGFSHQEIGDALDCSAEAARKLVARAHRKLVDQS